MTGQDQRVTDRLKTYKKAHEQKVALLSDATKMDKYISGITQQLSPTMKMALKSKADLLTDRVDFSIDDKSAMKGFGPEFRQRFSTELARPENAGYSANKIATGITRGMLEQTGPKGKTRLERAYANYRVEESNIDYFFTSGKDAKSKAPTALPGMPTYEEWKAKKREQEDVEKKHGGNEFLADLASTAWAGAVTGAGIGTVGGGPVTGVIGGAVGLTAAVTANILSYPIKKVLGKTEWYRARAASDKWTDNLVAGIAKFGPEAVGTLHFEKGINKAIRAFGSAYTAAVAKPTAVKLIEYKSAKDVLKSDVRKTVVKDIKEAGKFRNIKKSEGVKYVHNQAKKLGMDVADKETAKLIKSLGKEYGVLSKEGKQIANTDPEGLLKGITKQTEIEDALKYYSNEKTADTLVKKIKKTKTKTSVSKVTVKEAATETKVIAGKTAAAIIDPKALIEYKPIGDVAADAIMSQQAKVHEAGVIRTKAGKEVMEMIGRNSDEDKIAVAVQKTLKKDIPAVDKSLPIVDGRAIEIPKGLEEFAKTEEGLERISHMSGAKQITKNVAEPTDNIDFFYRAAVRIDDEVFHVARGVHITALESALKKLKIKPKDFDYSRIKGTGGVGPDGHYYETSFVGDVPQSVKRGAAQYDDLINDSRFPQDIPYYSEKGVAGRISFDDTLTETEAIIKQTKSTKYDYPLNFDESKHAYLPVTNTKLDDILSGGIKGGKFSPSAEGAVKTHKGKNIIRVKKEALGVDVKGKKTVTSKIEFGPENIEIKTEKFGWLSPEEYKNTKQLERRYDEVGDYYDELIVKYNPELKIPKVGAKADPKMEAALTKASAKIDKQLTSAETNKLNEMLSKYDELDRTVLKLKKEIPDISVDEMRTGMVDIMKAEKTGVLAVDDVIKQVEELSLRTGQSPTMAGVDKNESMGAMADYTARLRKQAGILKFFGMFGVGGALLDAITPSDAEAGMASTLGKFGKEAIEAAVTKTITGLKKQRLAVSRVATDDVFHLTEEGFQTGLFETANGGAKYFIKNLDAIYHKGSKRFAQGAMSPQSIFTEVLKATEGTLLNPAVFKATFFNAEAVNIKNGLRVISNIFKDGDVVSAQKEITKMFEPLTEKAQSQYLYDYHVKMVGEYQDKIMKLKKPDKETVNALKVHMYKHGGVAKKLKAEVADYHNAYQKIAQEAATKYSSARVFYAADDIGFKKYPFMKNMELSNKEKLATGRLKKQMAEYRKRLEKTQVRTKSGAYMHYALHPKMSAEMLAEAVGTNTAAPYMKNFTRSVNARPLVPDAVASMSRYVPDAERRIQTQAFWNSGWEEAMRKSAKIEPLRTAFQALKDGTEPFENTWGNTLARWYTTVEIFKRLFMSPSAGLKHLVKLTGDMATLGIGETLQAMPGSVKSVSYRVIENTPFMKRIAGNLYNPSQYTKLKKQLLDSVAPAMDTRYRMMQMGFGNYDTYFSKLGVIADKVNHVGGMFINAAELIDRGTTMEAGLRIAAKKGLTPDQAVYGIYDTILKNNFLGREFTPQWMRNPKFKAAFMFQTTPAKILGKKLVMAIRSNRAIKNGGKKIYHATKTAEGRQKLYTDLINLRKDIVKTDQELKVNLFLDAIKLMGEEQDFYGNKVIGQFAKDIMIMGAGTAATGSVGLNMHHHFFHVPFLKNSEYADTYGTLSLSPGINAVIDGSKKYNKKIENDEDSIRVFEILQKWAGKSGPFPDTLSKYNRIMDDNTPAIYNGSPLQYLFAIPSKKEKD